MIDQALYFQKFLLGLITTILIETIILFLSVRLILKAGKEQLSGSLLIFTGVLCSFATVPYLWFVLPFYFRTMPYYVFFIVGEISVTLIESIIIYFVVRLDYKRSLLLSVLCNAISLAIGLVFLR